MSNYCATHKHETKPCKICKENLAKWTLKAKLLCMNRYGSSCYCCGETEPAFLCIDHVNGGGNQHKRETFGHSKVGGYALYRWLIRNDFPEGFQFLCFNCNCAKQYNPGGCPHGNC